MKTGFLIIALCNLALPAFFVSCTSTGGLDKARAAQIGDQALALAVKTGYATPAEAALIREGGQLVLSAAPPASPAVTASGK